MPIHAAAGVQTDGLPCQHALPTATEDSLEQCFDDLRSAQSLVKKYEEGSEDDDDDDVLEFSEQTTKVMRKFRDAISAMNSSDGKEKVDACLDAYQKALDGRDIPGKFCRKWGKILKTKVGGTTFFLSVLGINLGSEQKTILKNSIMSQNRHCAHGAPRL